MSSYIDSDSQASIFYKMATIGTYVASTFDKEAFSDFKIMNKDKTKCLYVNSFILKSNTYFLTYLTSGVGGKKTELIVDNFEMAKIVISYLYTDKFSITDSIDIVNYIDLINLITMWCFPTNIKNIIFRYLHGHWKRFLEKDISCINSLYAHFSDASGIQWPESSASNAVTITWSGVTMIAAFTTYLVDNKDRITEDMLNWPIMKHVNQNIIVELYVKFCLYIKLNTIKDTNLLSNIVFHIKKYYKPSMKIFTLSQLSILKTCKYIGSSSSKRQHDGTTLVIDSFVPFSANLYTPIGLIHGKSKQHNSVFINPTTTVNKTDTVYFHDTAYTIKSIFLENDDVPEAYAGLDYSFCLNGIDKLPDRNTYIFKVEKLL